MKRVRTGLTWFGRTIFAAVGLWCALNEMLWMVGRYSCEFVIDWMDGGLDDVS